MDPIAASHGATLEAVALAWLRQQRVVTSTIVGVKSVEQLEANLKSVDVMLSDSEIKALNEIGMPAMEYPGWMLAQSAPRAQLLATGKLPENAH
jgi:aryl-alcohol dehydrogenase-like predicted oxidoreductase